MDFIDEQAQKEVLGENILTDRQLIIDYDRRRNGNREALRALKNTTDTKSWVSLGDMFIRLPNTSATTMVKEVDNERLVQEVEEVRERILRNTQKLEEMEGSETQHHKEGTFLKSFDLKPITAAELYNIDSSRD
ncbi:hypothetical protein IWQ62_002000 [Dispira parvispora]|uniref:P53 and DNA damage-regulated protein 1 n=1 Tax=Dispira parvispora TaxID=1520584 RepID=A0A9W8ARA9_9FUNG|nr:hypothetical protein IWQ62_002000 [Dispira parvispora]